jgi:transposase
MLPEHGADANGLAPEGMTKRELAEEVARLRAVPEEVARLRAALEAIKRESERGRYLDIPGMVDGALGE